MDDEQIKNAMGAIKTQLSSASLAQLSQLSSAVAGLLTYANSPEMENQIKDLQGVVEKRVEETERAAQSSQNISGSEKGRDDRGDKDKDIDNLAIESDKVYDQFYLTHKEDLASKKKYTKSLDKLLEGAKTGEISQDLENEVSRTPDQIKLEKERNQQRMEDGKKARAEAEARAANIERLKEELENAPSNKRKEIQAKIDYENKRLVKALSVHGDVEKHHQEQRIHIQRIREAKEVDLKAGGARQALFHKIESQNIATIADELVDKIRQEASIDNPPVVGQLKDKQAQEAQDKEMREAVKNDPKVVEAIRKSWEEQQNKFQKVSFPLTPPPTPDARKSSPNKDHDR